MTQKNAPGAPRTGISPLAVPPLTSLYVVEDGEGRLVLSDAGPPAYFVAEVGGRWHAVDYSPPGAARLVLASNRVLTLG